MGGREGVGCEREKNEKRKKVGRKSEEWNGNTEEVEERQVRVSRSGSIGEER